MSGSTSRCHESTASTIGTGGGCSVTLAPASLSWSTNARSTAFTSEDTTKVSSSKVTPTRNSLRSSISGPSGRFSDHADRILVQWAGQEVETNAQIVHRPREGSTRVHVGFDEVAGRPGNVASARHHAPRRLQPVHAAEVRRRPDGAADVAPQLERGDARGDCGRGTARRTAGGASGVPRVVGLAVHLVEGLVVAGVDRRVGLPRRSLRPRRVAGQPSRRRARVRGRGARVRRTW